MIDGRQLRSYYMSLVFLLLLVSFTFALQPWPVPDTPSDDVRDYRKNSTLLVVSGMAEFVDGQIDAESKGWMMVIDRRNDCLPLFWHYNFDGLLDGDMEQ